MAVCYLISNPESYQALRKELDDALSGKTLSISDVEKLPMLNGVINECLRLQPPASQGLVRRAPPGGSVSSFHGLDCSFKIHLDILFTRSLYRWFAVNSYLKGLHLECLFMVYREIQELSLSRPTSSAHSAGSPLRETRLSTKTPTCLCKFLSSSFLFHQT